MPNTITVEHINDKIRDNAYHVFPGTTVTACLLTLANGFHTLGYSACVDPANFDGAIGRQIAWEDAFRQVWQLEGYLLAEKNFAGKQETRASVSEESSKPLVEEAAMTDPMSRPNPFDLERPLTPGQLAALNDIIQLAGALDAYYAMEGSSRELALAETKLQESVFWAREHIRRRTP